MKTFLQKIMTSEMKPLWILKGINEKTLIERPPLSVGTQREDPPAFTTLRVSR